MTPADPDPPAPPAEVGSPAVRRAPGAAPPAEDGPEPSVRWWREIAYVVAFYAVYSLVRNLFGSASVDAGRAYANAVRVIDLERTLHVFDEATVQSWFLGVGWLLRVFNIFYGSAHFVITAATLVWLAWRRPRDYPTWRNTLMIATALALVGYALYPLMPPRLLCDCPYGAGPIAAADGLPHFVDTLAVHGGLWSFGNSTVQAISNQYAAMPSLHTAWALWCALVLVPRVRHRWSKALAAAYPFATVLTIVVTANHYWLDAAAGAACVGVGWLVGSRLAAMMVKRGRGGDTVAPSPPPTAGVSGVVDPAGAPHQGHDGKEASAP